MFFVCFLGDCISAHVYMESTLDSCKSANANISVQKVLATISTTTTHTHTHTHEHMHTHTYRCVHVYMYTQRLTQINLYYGISIQLSSMIVFKATQKQIKATNTSTHKKSNSSHLPIQCAKGCFLCVYFVCVLLLFRKTGMDFFLLLKDH